MDFLSWIFNKPHLLFFKIENEKQGEVNHCYEKFLLY